MSKELLKRMLDVSFEAGRIAMKYYDKSDPQLKNDHSVITKADTEISKLVHEKLRDLVQTSSHLVIDEENESVFDYLDQEFLEKAPYIWAIDPIDGTRVYANSMRHFGISIGLLKDLKPWLGSVYFPALNELFYCDGEHSYFVTDPFSKAEQKRQITPLDPEISYRSILLCDDNVFEIYDWDYKGCQVMISACACVDLCWPAIGRGCGGIFRSSIWDFAGSWPILRSAGMELRSIPDGRVLDSLDLKHFCVKEKSWQVRDYYIASSKRNFAILNSKLKKKNG